MLQISHPPMLPPAIDHPQRQQRAFALPLLFEQQTPHIRTSEQQLPNCSSNCQALRTVVRAGRLQQAIIARVLNRVIKARQNSRVSKILPDAQLDGPRSMIPFNRSRCLCHGGPPPTSPTKHPPRDTTLSSHSSQPCLPPSQRQTTQFLAFLLLAAVPTRKI